ncbi:MAG TPA: PilZ domain-containing protein [Nevskiaceae bacterium]|nr:PilZ domain-containing protein [Nevskiaceae bacterium]
MFEDCVSCEDVVPIAWRGRQGALSSGELHRLQELTLRALRAEPGEQADVKDPQLLRLHEKLDSVLEMMGRLLEIHHPAPQPAHVRLSRMGVAWRTEPGKAPPIGEHGVLELHLHPRLMQPLLLPAHVCAVEPRSGQVEVEVAFDSVPEPVETALERHIFRRHRRAISETRNG